MTVLLSHVLDDMVDHERRLEVAPVQHWEHLLRLAHWRRLLTDLHDRRN